MLNNQVKLPTKKRWIAFVLSLVLLMLSAAPACASYAEIAARYSARDGVKLWENTDGLGYARWENAANDKLKFRPKLYSHSKVLTLRAVDLVYYATDVWGDRVYGQNQYYRHTSKLTLKPGEKAYTDWVLLPERREIDRVYCGIKRLSYSDGTVVEFEDDEIEFRYWLIEW